MTIMKKLLSQTTVFSHPVIGESQSVFSGVFAEIDGQKGL